VPAALLVSTVFCRSAWRYRSAGTATPSSTPAPRPKPCDGGERLGIQTTTRLSMNDRNARELIGVRSGAPFGEAEGVQAMVVWAETAAQPMSKVSATEEAVPPPPPPPPVPAREPASGRLVPSIARDPLRRRGRR
jgi:hypothetical protein